MEPTTLRQLAGYLDQFKRIDSKTYRFRCPYCGDSKKSKTKTRGGIVEVAPDTWVFKCFNCFESKSYNHFLRDNAPELYKIQMFDVFSKDHTVNDLNLTEPETKPKAIDTPSGLVAINDLDKKHPAKQYVVGRKLPKAFIDKLFFTDDLWKVARQIDDKYNDTQKLHGIVVPLKDEQGKVFGLSFRNIDNESKLRYLTFRMKGYTKVAGLDDIDKSKQVHLFEGAFDAAFVRNSLASLDADLDAKAFLLQQEFDIKDIVIWFDDDVRHNAEVRKLKSRAIDNGFTVACYGKLFRGYGKDLNDIVMKHGRQKLFSLLKEVRFESGLMAKAMMLEEM